MVLVIGPRGQHTNFIDEHIVALELGGSNALKNRELRCIPHAKEKTSGTGATTAGTDIGKIKKVRHIQSGKMAVRKPRLGSRKSVTFKRRWPKRTFPKRVMKRA